MYSSDFKGLEKAFEDIKRMLPENYSLKDKICLELGPGNSEFIAKSLILNGAKKVFLIDKFPRCETTLKQKQYIIRENNFLKQKYKNADKWLINVSNIEFWVGDIGNFKSSRKFDFICSLSVLEHVKNPEKMIKSLGGIIKQGGLMYHKIDLRDHFNFANSSLFYKYPDLVWERYLTREGISYTNRLRYGEWLDIFKDSGFEIVTLKTTKMPVVEKLDKKFKKLKHLNIGVVAILLKKK
jgi:SAM-dependent methyltransferase